MSWNSRIIKKYGLHLDNSLQNRNKILELHKNDTLIILLNVSSIKRAKSDSLWLKTKDISTKLVKQINISKIDQYYHKIIRILRNTLFKKIIRHNLIIRSDNKKLRLDYKKGSNNIISLYAENQNLSEGCWTPKGMEHLPGKIIRENIRTIKRAYNK